MSPAVVEGGAAVQEGPRALAPWAGWVLGPVAWALHQVLGYALVPVSCRMGTHGPLHVLTLISMALAIAGIVLSAEAVRNARRADGTRSAERVRLMGVVGLALCAAAVTGVALEYGASLVLDICTGV